MEVDFKAFGALAVVAVVCLFLGAVAFSTTDVVEVEKQVIVEKPVLEKVQVEVPGQCPEIKMPEIEVPSFELQDDFYESYFEEEYTEVESNAEMYALEELEDEDYEVVFEYLEELYPTVDEDSLDVDVDDVDVTVTELGLKEDEDKVAFVEFEIEVEYELEEGVRDEFEEDLIVTYKVVFDEGDFDDEDVELVSIE